MFVEGFIIDLCCEKATWIKSNGRRKKPSIGKVMVILCTSFTGNESRDPLISLYSPVAKLLNSRYKKVYKNICVLVH